jgi:hypothetical protein
MLRVSFVVVLRQASERIGNVAKLLATNITPADAGTTLRGEKKTHAAVGYSKGEV